MFFKVVLYHKVLSCVGKGTVPWEKLVCFYYEAVIPFLFTGQQISGLERQCHNPIRYVRLSL